MSRRSIIATYLALFSLLGAIAWGGRDRLMARYFTRQCLEHPDWRQRANAALALGELGVKHAIPALEAARKDRMAPVRLNAGWALHLLTRQNHGGDPVGDLGLMPPWESINAHDGSFERLTTRAPPFFAVSLEFQPQASAAARLTIPEQSILATVTQLSEPEGSPAPTPRSEWYRAARYGPDGAVTEVSQRGNRPPYCWIRVTRNDHTAAGVQSSETMHTIAFPPEPDDDRGRVHVSLILPLIGGSEPSIRLQTLVWEAVVEPRVAWDAVQEEMFTYLQDTSGVVILGNCVHARSLHVRADDPALCALSEDELNTIADALESGRVQFADARMVYATGYTWNTNDDGSGHFGTDATASGRPARTGGSSLDHPQTLATDWTQFPKDTILYIGGIGWGRVDDKCGASVRDREAGAENPRVDCYLGRFDTQTVAEAEENRMTGVRPCVVFRPGLGAPTGD